MTGKGAVTPAVGAAAGCQLGDAEGGSLSFSTAVLTFAASGKALEQGALQSEQAKGTFDLLHDNDVDDIHQHQD